jgi:hypothetical protein
MFEANHGEQHGETLECIGANDPAGKKSTGTCIVT